jgi:hypothetical protein
MIRLKPQAAVGVARAHDRVAHAALGRAEHVGDREPRQVLDETLLHLEREHRAGRDERVQARRVPTAGMLVERAEHRSRERVAHDHEQVHALPRHRVPQLDRIEAAVREQRRGAAEHVRHHHAEPAAGAVHERRPRHRDGRAPGRVRRAREVGQVVGAAQLRHADHLRVGLQEEAREVTHRVHHALRHAGRAAGVEHVELVALRRNALGGREALL